MLAFLPARQAQSILVGPRQAMTPYTVTDLHELQALLEQVHRDGYVINNQEAFIGDISVAAPILNADREVVGAVNIAVPTPRWSIDRSDEHTSELQSLMRISYAVFCLKKKKKKKQKNKYLKRTSDQN